MRARAARTRRDGRSLHDSLNSAWDGLDQLFGDNAVFRSESGDVVLTVRVSEIGGTFDRVIF